MWNGNVQGRGLPECGSGVEWLRAHNFEACYRYEAYTEICTISPDNNKDLVCQREPTPQ
jgi:hypothetical protein